MQKNINPLFLDINSLVFKHNEVSLNDFSLFISKYHITENDTIPLLYFLILKNNLNFFYLIKDKISYDFSFSSYSLQLIILKTYNSFESIFSNNLNNSSLISSLIDSSSAVKQILFDFSVLFDDSDSLLFFNKKVNIQKIILGKSPIKKYNLLKSKMTLKQKKQLLLSCLNEFRVSSFFIVNDLFYENPNLFNKLIILKNMNFWAQCNKNIQQHFFNTLINIDNNKIFISGLKLSYTNFDYDFFISFFEKLYVKNSELFSIMACGFISNPQNHNSEVSNYLIKKKSFESLSNKLINKSQIKTILIKI